MTSITTARLDGLSSSTAIKGPCNVATTANITLSGTQTIDGIAVVTDDRVLVKNQTSASENGIWVCDTGPWRRTADFEKTRDVRKGTLVAVAGGTVGQGIWELTTADPVVVGTSNITFALAAAAWAVLSAGMAFTDTSSVVGSAAKMWNPTYFGNPGTAIVHRMNRLLVGEATANSSDIPSSTKSWMENLLTNTVATAQLGSVSATGNLGVMGAARTSDYRTWAGAASGGSQGVTGFGWNDDTTPATTPIAVGADFRGFRKATVNGITVGAQIAAANEGSTVDITPFGGVNSGSTMALLLTNGPGPTGYVNPISAHLVMGSGSGSEVSRKGIISLNGALSTSLGLGGGGITYEAYRGQSFRWLNSGSTVDAEFWGDAAGFKVATVGGVQFNVANVASAVNYLQLKGAATAGTPQLSALGSDANVSLGFATQGTGLFDFFTAGSVRQFRVYDTPSAVNYIQLSGSATGAATTFACVGADATVSMAIVAKSTGSIFINSGAVRSAEFQAPASGVNNMLIQGAVTTAGPLMITSGSDTNITGILRGKGTGGFDLQDGGSLSKFKYNTTGIGFFNATPVARGAQAALTGTIQRGTFDTATVTLPQLAGVVMAIINDWRAYGLAS